MKPARNNLDKTIIWVSLFYAVSLMGYLIVRFLLPFDFQLTDFPKLIISAATQANVDVSARVSVFYKLIISGSIGLVLFYFLFRLFYKRIQNRKNYLNLLYLAAPLFILSFLRSTGAELNLILDIIAITGLLFLLFQVGHRLTGKTLSHGGGFIFRFDYLLTTTFFLFLLWLFLFGHLEMNTASNLPLIWGGIFGITFLMGLLLHKFLNDNILKLFFLLFSGIPFIVFIAIEVSFYFLIREETHVGYKWLFIGLAGLWLLISYCILRYKNFSLQTILKKGIAPAVIFGYCLLAFYTPVVPSSQDFFELANPANALMRIFHFHEIPLLDFMSSHLLYEQWYGILYQFIFGANNSIDFTIYAFLNLFLALFVVYLILIHLNFKPLKAAFFLILCPISLTVFFPPVAFTFLILILIKRYRNFLSSSKIYLLLLSVFCLMIWRIDTGVDALFCLLVFLPIYCFISKVKFPFRRFIVGGLFFIATLLVFLLIAILLRGTDIISNHFLLALHYITGSQAHGYPDIFNGSYHQFYTFTILFTLVALFLIVYSSIILKRYYSSVLFSEGKWLVFAVFAFIAFLGNAQRGLVRHGFGESSEIFFAGTFFIGIAFFILHFFRQHSDQIRFTVLFLLVFLTFYTWKYYPFLPKKMPINTAFLGANFADLHLLLGKDTLLDRTEDWETFSKSNFLVLSTYFDAALKPKETFLDFSNTPMLYYYCNRRVPGYFNQNLQNTIDGFSQQKYLEALSTDTAPLVVYSNYPISWFDKTDGVDNQLRYYLLAEYIYQNYRPLGVINKKSVWGAKDRDFPYIAEKDTIWDAFQQVELNYIPGWAGNFIYQHEEALQTVLSKEIVEGGDTITFEIPDNIPREGSYFLVFSTQDTTVLAQDTFIVRNNYGKKRMKFIFQRKDKQFNYYAIRLSNHYFWYNQEKLIIKGPNGKGIAEIALIKDSYFED